MCVVGLVIFMYSILLCISFVLHVKKKKKIRLSRGCQTLAGAFTWRELLVRMLNL